MYFRALRLLRPTRRLLTSACVTGGLCLAAMSLGAPVSAAETGVEPDSMPTVVKQVLAAKYPGWNVERATRVDGIGKAEYRIRLTDDSTAIDVILDEAGHIVEAARGVNDVVAATTEPAKPKKDKSKVPEIYGFMQNSHGTLVPSVNFFHACQRYRIASSFKKPNKGSYFNLVPL